MDYERRIKHLEQQVADLLRRLARVPALEARQGRRAQCFTVALTATLTAGGKVACKRQKLSYNSIPTPTEATWGDLSPSQTLEVFDAIMIPAGLTGYTFPSGTVARVEADPETGVLYFTDFYACPTAPG